MSSLSRLLVRRVTANALGFALSRPTSACVARLPLPRFVRANACVRMSPFWYGPVVARDRASLAAAAGEREITGLLVDPDRGGYVATLALVGPTWRAVFHAGGRAVTVHVVADGGARVPRATIIAVQATAHDPSLAVERAYAAAREILPGFRLRQEKTVPPFVDLFGWCTWDAFYTDVNAAGVLRGVRTLRRGGITPGFVLVDDGWQQVRDGQLTGFHAVARKFPGGLSALVRRLRRRGIQCVGVWHTLQGYWHGVDPTSSLGRRYHVVSSPKTSRLFDSWPAPHRVEVRHPVAIADIDRFYQDFYRRLGAAGISFTKVDNQATLEHFAGRVLPRSQLHEAYQRAVQAATASHLSGTLHCMANTHDVALRLNTSVVWRNSDDFFPREKSPAQAAHVWINGLNNLWSAPFAVPDWDAFQSTHPAAAFHAAARAISGGPLYVTDRPGEHDFALLRRLVLPDGRIPRFQAPARPAAECLFHDGRREPFALQLVNGGPATALLGLFNCWAADDGRPFATRWRVRDIFGEAAACLAYDPVSGTLRSVVRGGGRVRLAPLQFALRTVARICGGEIAAMGLLNHWAGAAAVGSVEACPDRAAIEARYGGNWGFWTRRAVVALRWNGRKIAFRRSPASGLVRTTTPGTAGGVFAVEFEG